MTPGVFRHRATSSSTFKDENNREWFLRKKKSAHSRSNSRSQSPQSHSRRNTSSNIPNIPRASHSYSGLLSPPRYEGRFTSPPSYADLHSVSLPTNSCVPFCSSPHSRRFHGTLHFGSGRFSPIEQPQEPKGTDFPVDCPHPEPSILYEGKALKKKFDEITRGKFKLLSIREDGTELTRERSCEVDHG